GRLQRSPGRPSRAGCSGAIGFDGDPPQGGLGDGVSGVEPALPERQALRLRLGRWLYFNIRLEEDRQCILVLMGATAEGKKELIAIADGFRESEQSWLGLLLDCKARGLNIDPKLAVGDGALGFWKALPQVYPTTREQRCWVHKTANVLDKLPKSLQARAKEMLHDIWQAPTRLEADKAFDLFVATFEAKYP